MNSLIPANVQVPAHLAAYLGKQSALAQDISSDIDSGGGIPRISIKGSRFRIIEGGVETVLDSTYIDVIIVGANPRKSKMWYEKPWSPDAEPAGADCFSMDSVSPDAQSPSPQSDLCATCPHNAWGSKIGPTGQELKACADQKRLAVVSAEDPSGPIYLLTVTAAALAGLNQYQKELNMRAFPPEIIQTRVSFDTTASYPKLTFKFNGFLDEDAIAAVGELFGSEAVREITGVPSAKPVAIAPPVAPRPSPVKPAPAPVAPAPVEAPEPVAPKRGFGAKAAAPKAAAPRAAAPKAAPKAAPAESNDLSDIMDEIAALVSEVADDA